MMNYTINALVLFSVIVIISIKINLIIWIKKKEHKVESLYTKH
jgi:hypothetical protein